MAFPLSGETGPFASLQHFLARTEPLAVALSGGLDSRFLCLAALKTGCDVIALHVSGPHIAKTDTAYARAWASSVKLPFHEISFNPLKFPEVAVNSRKRCYVCKKSIFSAIQGWLRENGQEKRVLCDGGNRDDLKKFRPGLAACQEAGVISPLALSGFGKNEIRHHGRLIGLANPDQAAKPCLLTRFSYGYHISEDEVLKAAAIEEEVQSFFEKNKCPVPEFRLRFTPAPQLHLAYLPENTEASLKQILGNHGLTDCEIRIMPHLSGFFDSAENQP